MAGHLDPPELLDVDVDELAGARALVAVGRLWGSSRERLPRPILASQRETVESAILSTSAISAAVMRRRRSASITSIVWTGVLAGTRLGAEERSAIGSPRR